MPTPRWDLTGGVVNGVFYAVGGGDQSVPTGVNEAYDPATDSWTTKASMLAPRWRLAGGVVNGMLYAVGGSFVSSQTVATATVEAFTPPYLFAGFFSPVDNPDVVNVAKAGSAIPVKFSLGSDLGLNILSAGSPSSAPYTCGSGPTDDIEQTVTATSSGLQYDATANQYAYVWKTDKTWSGTCRKFSLGLTDGSTRVALFQFK